MSDEDDIASVVADYWWGWFDGEAARIEAAMHQDLAKRGVVTDDAGQLRIASMSAGQMVGWARDGDGVRERPDDASYDCVINDIYHQAATVTLTSGIYREYLHLVQTPHGWKILNALYQRV